MKKKVLAALLTLALLLAALTGCAAKKETDLQQSADPSAASDEKTADAPFKVAFICQADDQWFRQCFAICKDRIEQTCDNVEFVMYDSKSDQSKCDAIMEQLIMEGDWGLCSFITASDNTALVKQLQETGCNVVCIPTEWDWNKDVCSTFTCSDYDLGFLTAQAVLSDLPEQANVVLLRGVEGYVGTNLRGEGFHKALEARPDIHVLDEKYCSFSKADAVTQMEDWIVRYGDEIDGIIAENDSMALGAIEALNAAGIDASKLVIGGIDALYEGAVAIRDGLIDYSAYNDAENYADAYARRIRALQDGTLDAACADSEYFDAGLIDSSNVDELIAKYESLGFSK